MSRCVIYVTSNWAAFRQTAMTVNQSKINTNALLEKLIDIEQSIGIETDATIRNKVREAQEFVIQLLKSGRSERTDRQKSE